MKDYSFGNYICALRTGLGLSQFQLGTLVGVSDKAVSKWENGDAKPRLSTCYRLAEVLGVTVNELLSCEQNETIPARKELEKMNKELWKQAYERLSLYGKNPPAACWSRLAAEEAAFAGTDAIQSFALLGEMAKTAQEENSNMIMATAVTSSYTAWLLGATEVNPLPPHYRCPHCGTVEFVSGVSDGFDLPQKQCVCGKDLIRDGHNIPFEGYAKSVQKRVDIELRLSEKFAPTAIRILKEFYKGKAEILQVTLIVDGHRIGLEKYVIMPKHRAKPALSEDGTWHVSPEDFWNWQERETVFTFILSHELNKLDMCYALSGMRTPSFTEMITAEMVEALFEQRCKKYHSITNQIPADEIHDFDLLTRIDGFAHGTWDKGYGDISLHEYGLPLRAIPATREDVWNDIHHALTKNAVYDGGLALVLMESVRFGRFSRHGLPENIRYLLLSMGLPKQYCDYLEKISYLFPKGHCIAFMMAEMKILWYRQMCPPAYAEACKMDDAYNLLLN